MGTYSGPPNMRILIRYLLAEYVRESRETSYRAYVTDSLRLVPQMSYMQARWIDVVTPRSRDGRSGDEIADSVLARLGER